jgi:hypothetical protein
MKQNSHFKFKLTAKFASPHKWIHLDRIEAQTYGDILADKGKQMVDTEYYQWVQLLFTNNIPIFIFLKTSPQRESLTIPKTNSNDPSKCSIYIMVLYWTELGLKENSISPNKIY